MRRFFLIPAALSACAALALFSGAQQAGNAVKAAASTTPTIDQSLEWKSAFNPKISPDGKRVVYEVQKTNWEDNAFERNLWIADAATNDSHALTSAKKSSSNAEWSLDGNGSLFFPTAPDKSRTPQKAKNNSTLFRPTAAKRNS